MGVFDMWRKQKAMTTNVVSTLSPSSHLVEVGGNLAALGGATSREVAMTIPAMVRARNLICTTAARLTIIAARDGEDLEEQPAWISRTDGLLSPFHRMLWTIDDLLFYGWSLWHVTRDYNGHVLTANRVAYEQWTFGDHGQVMVGGLEAQGTDYVLIPGIHEGLINLNSDAIPQALAMTRGVTKAVETPAATVELHQTNDRPLSKEEIQDLISSWVAARKGKNGGVAFTSSGIEAREHGAPIEHLLIEGRNAVAVDIARLAGIPASMIDASINGTSLTYNNAGSRMGELITFGVAPMISAVTARMGMDDVVPRGVSLRVDAAGAIETIGDLLVQDDTKGKPNDTV